MTTKDYLGDSVYVDWDGVGKQLVLAMENGDGFASNTIYINIDVLNALVKYFERLKFNSQQP